MAKKARSPTPSDAEEVYEVEKVTSHREVESQSGKAGRFDIEFLVKWKGYPDNESTWEPRSSLLDGAESILQAYLDKQEKRGNPVPNDNVSRRKSTQVEKVKDSRPPASTDSSKESSKRKKKESLPAQVDEEEASRARKKEKRREVVVDASPEPEVRPKKVAKEPAEIVSVKKVDSQPLSRHGSEEENVPPAPSPAPPKKRKSQAAEPEVTIEVPKPLGSHLYRNQESWENLVNITTLEQDETESQQFRWHIEWIGQGGHEWIESEVARLKFPQKMIDFFVEHLKFKPGPPEGGDVVEDGDAMEQ